MLLLSNVGLDPAMDRRALNNLTRLQNGSARALMEHKARAAPVPPRRR
jgi:hypothetical protein